MPGGREHCYFASITTRRRAPTTPAVCGRGTLQAFQPTPGAGFSKADLELDAATAAALRLQRL